MREDQKIKQRSEHGREYRLHADFPEAQPFLVEKRIEAGDVRVPSIACRFHRKRVRRLDLQIAFHDLRMLCTKTSSRSGCITSISWTFTPVDRKAAIRPSTSS